MLLENEAEGTLQSEYTRKISKAIISDSKEALRKHQEDLEVRIQHLKLREKAGRKWVNDHRHTKWNQIKSNLPAAVHKQFYQYTSRNWKF